MSASHILHNGQLSTQMQYIPVLYLAYTFHAFNYLDGRSSYKQLTCYMKHRQFYCPQLYCNGLRFSYYETVR